MKVVVAITGASGVAYGLRLLEVLKEKGIEVTCIISEPAKKVMKYELERVPKLSCVPENEIDASIASGSSIGEAMVVIPCSMKTLSAIANGYADNIITRAADVVIKEQKKLILVPRETPLNAIHLENMLKLARLGVVILPAMPAFYHKPKKVEDIINFVVGKVLDSLGIENSLFKRWRGKD